MLTFKEALFLLATVVAILALYGIAGRMDHDDDVLLQQVRQHVGADGALPRATDDGSLEVDLTEPLPAARFIESNLPDESCVPPAAADVAMRPTRH